MLQGLYDDVYFFLCVERRQGKADRSLRKCAHGPVGLWRAVQAGQTGSSNVRVEVDDGEDTEEQMFTVTINSAQQCETICNWGECYTFCN